MQRADNDSVKKANAAPSSSRPVVVDYHTPKELGSVLDLQLDDEGVGKAGLLDLVEKTLQYSINTWDQGFMDKLYASTNPVGVISELVLGVLNTNMRSPSILMAVERCANDRCMSIRYHRP